MKNRKIDLFLTKENEFEEKGDRYTVDSTNVQTELV